MLAGVVGPGLLGLVLTVQVAFIASQLPSAPANYAAAAAKFQWTAGLIPCDAATADPPIATIFHFPVFLASNGAKADGGVMDMDRVWLRASHCVAITCCELARTP